MRRILLVTAFALLGAACEKSPPVVDLMVPELPEALFQIPPDPHMHDPETLTLGEAAEDAYRMFEHIQVLKHIITEIHRAHREAVRISRRQ